jgi:hypothetical protein
MTPGTKAKADAIRAGLTHYSKLDLAVLLAQLTSASKDEREHAKGIVRGLVASAERSRIQQEHAAQLAAFANRCDQDAGDELRHFRICCACGTIWPAGIELPPGHTHCPNCKEKCTTGESAPTIEEAIAKRSRGRKYKIWKQP